MEGVLLTTREETRSTRPRVLSVERINSFRMVCAHTHTSDKGAAMCRVKGN
jgi:hypothetical protein